MKKRNFVSLAIIMALTLVMTCFPVLAAEPTVSGKYLDNFERAKLQVDDSNKTLSDGTVIYWNGSGAGTFSITNGILSAQMNEGGYYRFATNNSESYKYVVVRIKGDSKAVNDKIYVRMGAAESGSIDDNAARGDKSFAQLLGPDGKAVPALTAEWQNIVIDVAQSGFKLGGGSNGFQIGTWQAMNLDIDYIFMTNDNPSAPVQVKSYDITINSVDEGGKQLSTEAVKVEEKNSYKANAKEVVGYTCTGYKLDSDSALVQGTSYSFNEVNANHVITFVYKANPAPAADTPKESNPESIINGGIIDNFNRSSLNASNLKLSDGTTIYWNQSGAGTFSVSNGALKAKMNDGGFYRLATNNTESYKYVVIRIKGDSRAVNEKIYTRIGVAERGEIDDSQTRPDKSFADILGPNGKPLPKITGEWQNIVVDLSKNGFKLGGGSNAFQIGSWQPMNLDIDFIYMTNSIPNPGTGDNSPVTAGTAAVIALAGIAAFIFLSRKKAA